MISPNWVSGSKPPHVPKLMIRSGEYLLITYCIDPAEAIFPQPLWKNEMCSSCNRMSKHSPKGKLRIFASGKSGLTAFHSAMAETRTTTFMQNSYNLHG